MENAQKQAEREFGDIIRALNDAIGDKQREGCRNFVPIRKDTGISTSWLSAFADGKLQEAGFKRLFVLGVWLRANGYLNHEGCAFPSLTCGCSANVGGLPIEATDEPDEACEKS